ncbi:hypothetical protein MHBO_002812, partial [Bonamia ostreae]
NNICESLSQAEIDEIYDVNGETNTHEGIPTQIQWSLTLACGAQNNNVVQYLLTVGGIADITSCFYAVKGGNFHTIRILVQHGADLQERRKSLSKWDTITSVLEEAALQKQEHLLLPLLQCCPDLKYIRSSIGASAVHFAASAGNVQVLEDLIKSSSFTPYEKTNIGSTILHFASQNNRFDAVKHIVKKYEDLFKDEFYCYAQGTILHTAAQSGNFELFKYLFDKNVEYLDKCRQNNVILSRGCYVRVNGKKCSVVAKEYLLNVEDESGISLLQRAVETGNKKLSNFILDNRVCDITHDTLHYSLWDIAYRDDYRSKWKCPTL